MKKLTALILTLTICMTLASYSGKAGEATLPGDSGSITISEEGNITGETGGLTSESDESSVYYADDAGTSGVNVTIPQALITDEVTQESLDMENGKKYVSAVLGEDGSVTYSMTESQRIAMMDELADEIDSALAAMALNGSLEIMETWHNRDFSIFDITCSSPDTEISESGPASVLFIYGERYAAFAGTNGSVTVNFLAPDGSLIKSLSSSPLGEVSEGTESMDGGSHGYGFMTEWDDIENDPE